MGSLTFGDFAEQVAQDHAGGFQKRAAQSIADPKFITSPKFLRSPSDTHGKFPAVMIRLASPLVIPTNGLGGLGPPVPGSGANEPCSTGSPKPKPGGMCICDRGGRRPLRGPSESRVLSRPVTSSPNPSASSLMGCIHQAGRSTAYAKMTRWMLVIPSFGLVARVSGSADAPLVRTK